MFKLLFFFFYRLLVQLEETERTFCDFQTEHFLRLKQWLDRRIFERDVTELEAKFDQYLKTVNDMIEVGESVNRVDQLIKEANGFHKLCLVSGKNPNPHLSAFT